MRIALIGNCQVHTLAALAGSMVDEPEIRLLDYSEPSSRFEETRRSFADGLEQCDVILAQTSHMSFTGEEDLRARYAGKLITIANFYFRGLFPDSCYIGDFEHRPHDSPHFSSTGSCADSRRFPTRWGNFVDERATWTLDRWNYAMADG